jgi:hypothetical protein
MTNLIGIRRLADKLDCHVNTIRNRVRAGTIRQPFTVPGSDRWVWIEAEIDRDIKAAARDRQIIAERDDDAKAEISAA